jgi:aromatic-L-amino-acid/L-tryptophan decarboxylase
VLIRAYGLDGLREMLRGHVAWAQELAELLRADPRFEIVTDPVLSLFTFRLRGADDAEQLDYVNRINADGRIYITQTRVRGRIAIRFQVGQFGATRDDVMFALPVLRDLAP